MALRCFIMTHGEKSPFSGSPWGSFSGLSFPCPSVSPAPPPPPPCASVASVRPRSSPSAPLGGRRPSAQHLPAGALEASARVPPLPSASASAPPQREHPSPKVAGCSLQASAVTKEKGECCQTVDFCRLLLIQKAYLQ